MTNGEIEYNGTRNEILKILREEGSVTRPILAQKLHLTRAAIGLHINDLMEDGLVEEVGRARSAGGRKAIMIAMANDINCTLGLALHDQEFFYNLSDFGDNSLFSGKIKLGRNIERERLWSEVAKVTEKSMDILRRGKLTLRETLFAVGADFDSEGTVVDSLHFPMLKGVNLKKRFRREYDIDCEIVSAGEAMFPGLLKKEMYDERVGVLYWLTGVSWRQGRGSGIQYNEKILPGIKHLPHQQIVKSGGRACYCGESGCLEVEAGGIGIIRSLTEKNPTKYRNLSISEVADMAAKGDVEVVELMAQAIRNVGKIIAQPALLYAPKYLRVVTCLGLNEKTLLDNLKIGLGDAMRPFQIDAVNMGVIYDVDTLLLEGMAGMARLIFTDTHVRNSLRTYGSTPWDA